MKMVDVNAAFIREAKLAKDTHRYVFSMWNYTSSTQSSMKQNYCRQQEIICSRNYDLMIQGITHKS